MIWFPVALWALFAIIIVFLKNGNGSDPANTGAAFLGAVLPLIGGILSAYCVLDDPSLELHFASPRSMASLLLERWGLILAMLTVTSILFQVYLAAIGIDLSAYGSLWRIQLAWLVPCLATIALGSFMAFALAQTTFGALAVGLVWVFEVLARSWFAYDPVARYFYLFLGIHIPDHPQIFLTYACLLALTALFTLGGWALLKKQERYI
jgi:hypothetical protein